MAQELALLYCQTPNQLCASIIDTSSATSTKPFRNTVTFSDSSSINSNGSPSAVYSDVVDSDGRLTIWMGNASDGALASLNFGRELTYIQLTTVHGGGVPPANGGEYTVAHQYPILNCKGQIYMCTDGGNLCYKVPGPNLSTAWKRMPYQSKPDLRMDNPTMVQAHAQHSSAEYVYSISMTSTSPPTYTVAYISLGALKQLETEDQVCWAVMADKVSPWQGSCYINYRACAVYIQELNVIRFFCIMSSTLYSADLPLDTYGLPAKDGKVVTTSCPLTNANDIGNLNAIVYNKTIWLSVGIKPGNLALYSVPVQANSLTGLQSYTTGVNLSYVPYVMTQTAAAPVVCVPKGWLSGTP